MKLHELSQELRDLEAMIEEGGETIDHDSFSAALEALNIDRDKKIEQLALWVKELKAEAEAIKDEEKRLAKRRKGKESRVEGLRGYIVMNLPKTVKTPLITVSKRAGSKSVFVENESLIPPEYFNQPDPVLDRAKVKAALDSGTQVPGAKIVTGQPSAMIR